MSSEPPIVCEGVGYDYPDGTRANQGIDLVIERGELFCLLGPNGAGKTTLIRQITTELRPTSGRIRVAGADAHADPVATKRRLGVIPQSASLFEGLSVETHLRLFGPLKPLLRAVIAGAPIPGGALESAVMALLPLAAVGLGVWVAGVTPPASWLWLLPYLLAVASLFALGACLSAACRSLPSVALAPTALVALLAWTLVFVLASLRWFPWTDRP